MSAVEVKPVKSPPNAVNNTALAKANSSRVGGVRKVHPRGAAARRAARRLNASLIAETRRKRPSKQRRAATGLRAKASVVAPGWISGLNVWDYGTECWDLYSGPQTKLMLSSFSSYYGASDASSPRVGDRYAASVLMGVTGLPCGSLEDVATDIVPPPGSVVSTDAQNKVRCYVKSPSAQNYVDVTDQTWSVPNPARSGYWCRSGQPSNGIYGANLGQVLLGQGWSFELVYPLLATKPLHGSGTTTDKLTAVLQSSNLYQLRGGLYYAGNSAPYVWTWVADRAPEFAEPASSAIGNNTAHTQSVLYSYWKTGETWFDIGETAAYGTESPHYPIGSDLGFRVDQDWAGLKPGTTYHWRLNFRNTATGAISRGPDQTFTTTGTPGSGGGGTGPIATGGGSGNTNGSENSGGTGNTTTGNTNTGTPPDTAAPAVATAVAKSALKIKTAMSKGLATTVNCGEPCTASAEVVLAGATAKKLKLSKGKPVVVAKGSAYLASGSGKVAAKFTSKAKKKLKKLKSVKLTLRVTATDAANNRSAPVSRKLTLKR